MIEVYRNLRYKNRTWSVKSKRTKRVVARKELVLIKNPTFIVRESGRQRVLKEKRKNVHAFVLGTWVRDKAIIDLLMSKKNIMKLVTYNPYKNAFFNEVQSGLSVMSSGWALLDSEGLWIL